jgi:hypothetical protein
MKTLLILIGLTAVTFGETKPKTESVVIGGRTIEIPASKVKGAMVNRDPKAELEAIMEKQYEGTPLGRRAMLLLRSIDKDGPTDAHLAALVQLKKDVAAAPEMKPAPRQPVVVDPKLVAFNTAIAKGFDTKLGFVLPLEDANRNDFTQLVVLVSTALQTGAITPETPQSFTDIEGKVRTLQARQFLQMMLGYGAYYKGLWDAQHAAD